MWLEGPGQDLEAVITWLLSPGSQQASHDSGKGHGLVAGPLALLAESLTGRNLDWLVLSPSLPIT